MNNIKLARYPFLLAAELLLASSTAQAALPLVEIKTYGQHIGGNIVYQYQVINNSVCNIGHFAIAEDTDETGSTTPYTRDQGELSYVFPLGYTNMGSEPIDASSVSSLPNWDAHIVQIEDSGLYLDWYSDRYADPAIPAGQPISPGQTARFSVTTPKMDTVYVKGHFSAQLGLGGACPWKYNDVMQSLDTTPPVLTVTLTPASTTLAQRGQLVAINATITVKDDYDPAPEIKLLSIVANQPLTAADVQGAAIGTDDRSFSLLASRTNPMVIRTYMISYIATDASGNTSRASIMLTVN